jgi:lipase ATG15
MLPTSLLISLLLAISATTTQVPLVYQPSPLTFHLRHLHAVTNTSRILFSDVSQEESLQNSIHGTQDSYTLMTRMMKTHRPSSFASFARARMKPYPWGDEDEPEGLSWGEDDVLGPDVTHRESLLHLAKMTNNAYAYPNNGDGREWYDLGHNWNIVCFVLCHVYHQ